ncbi:MAG: hypothetical protein LUC19_03010 [Oscillospiraceae bacterium]|nr:hypothetical protein [Oscillospiraceae bacterium]
MADSTTNTVVLSTQAYNNIKNENFRYNLFLDSIFQKATLSEDHQSLVFDTKDIENALQFCYYERYKKKLATLKTQAARYGSRENGAMFICQ